MSSLATIREWLMAHLFHPRPREQYDMARLYGRRIVRALIDDGRETWWHQVIIRADADGFLLVDKVQPSTAPGRWRYIARCVSIRKSMVYEVDHLDEVFTESDVEQEEASG